LVYIKITNGWENSGLGNEASKSIAASTSTRNELKKEIEGDKTMNSMAFLRL